MRSSILDLGSTSFHLLVADVQGWAVVPVLRERHPLRLGGVVGAHGRVTDDARAAANASVAHLADLARRAGATTRLVVATSALREAENGDVVLAELSDAAGQPVQVLDGTTEAAVAYRGARAAVAIERDPTLVFDLGGGSLELAVGTGREVGWTTSLPLGASRLAAAIGAGPLDGAALAHLTEQLDAQLDLAAEQLRPLQPVTTIGLGGPVRALARVAAARAGAWLPGWTNQYRVSLAELAAVRDELLALDLDERVEVTGLPARRAEQAHVAAAVLVRLLERTGSDAVVVCDWGLREGLLLDATGATTPPTADELRTAEVDRVRRAFVPDDRHGPHVARLAGQLVEAMAPLHPLAREDRELLEHAARLHPIGRAVALQRRHRHSAYLVQHAALRGFAPTQVAQLATLVRFHRPGAELDPSYGPFAALDTALQERTRRSLALLQLADALDAAHDGAVRGVGGHRVGHTLELHVDGPLGPAVASTARGMDRTFGAEVAVTNLAS